MKDKNILLGITGGIAAYKAAALTSLLTKKGANVQVIMTHSATKFITPLTLQTLSKKRVLIDTFDEDEPKAVSHIDAADNADLVIIAPASANIIGKLAHGIADDMLSTTLLAVKSPIFIAPAMNVNMYESLPVQANMKLLAERGVQFIEPNEGMLACGYVGKGRMAEPEEIVERLEEYFSQSQQFKGKKLLITAGATREAIDPVRYITNRSSGKMGYALAEVAISQGAEVILVSGMTNINPPQGAKIIYVESAEDMYQAVMGNVGWADIIIKAAAVADYRPKEIFEQKFKKSDANWTIELGRTKDIAYEIGKVKREDQLLIGFAAETENLVESAIGKIKKKNLDMIVANNVATEGAGFDVDTNIVTLITKEGKMTELPLMSKKELAKNILAETNNILAEINKLSLGMNE